MQYELIIKPYPNNKVLNVFRFDGIQGEIDLKPELYGPMFEPLLDLHEFRKFSIHPQFRTLVWESGADVAPEFLHEKAKSCGAAQENPRP